MTPKQTVKHKFPCARTVKYDNGLAVVSDNPRVVGAFELGKAWTAQGAWKKASEKCAEFDRLQAKGDEEMKPMRDAIAASTKLTAEDFSTTIP